MENSLRANPLDIREQYVKQLKDLQKAYGDAMLELPARKMPGPAGWAGSGHGCTTGSTLPIQQGLLAEGIKVPLTRLCAWFGVLRPAMYDRPTKAAPKVDPHCAEPIKVMIKQEPSFGYRTLARLLGVNNRVGTVRP